MPFKILSLYGIHSNGSKVQPLGDGLINRTWKVETDNRMSFVLQQINHSVFKNPEYIDQNIEKIKAYLTLYSPNYLFVCPVPTIFRETLVKTEEGYFRMTPYVENSHTLNVVLERQIAKEAAKQFGRFSMQLKDFDIRSLNITLPDFHNLNLRYNQFLHAVNQTPQSLRLQAKEEITYIIEHQYLVDTYNEIVENQIIPTRVIHHDTKISNVLFDDNKQGLCVIDLDTVMPGYFISDVGDMMRTYLSPVDEEEINFDNITIRIDFFSAIYEGYMEEMGEVLTEKEKEYFIYAGKFLIFMQGIRFLTDFLLGDPYYGKKYEGHNLNRAKNQLCLLKRYIDAEDQFLKIMAK